jgi:NADH-quinone oxidoreductase subunit K
MEIPLSAYLTLALILFCIGLFGALTKRNIILILLSIELMLNAVNINLVAFSKYGFLPGVDGQIFTLFVMTVAASEVAVGIALLMVLFRQRGSLYIQEITSLKDES